MSLVVYLYPKCSTCKKASKFLQDHKIACDIKEIQLTPPSKKELEAMLNHMDGDIRKLFNTSGIQYRELNLAKKLDSMPKGEAFELLSSNGMLVKRPFVLGKNIGLAGFQETKWEATLVEKR